jgi:hypothetical protein
MIRFIAALFCSTFVLGADMARSDTRTLREMPSPMKDGQKDSWQQYMDSEEGKAIQFYGDKVRRGEMSLDDARAEFRKKFYGGSQPNYNAIIEGAQ